MPTGQFFDNRLVWAPDGRDGFCLGKIVDIGADTISVQLVNKPAKPVSAPYSSVHASEDNNEKDYDDNCSLMYLNEATLLHNLRIRYKKNKIYTYVANILIAVNPYQEFPQLYSKETITKYKGRSLGTLPPHVFAIADKAYRDMKVLKQNQSIIVSGESGAGKTESTKYILRYLTEASGASRTIEQRIIEANPLLEAFGNSKTLRNLNSSRFGKYVEVHFGAKGNLEGAFISHYLLEKSRVCRQSGGERNYHVFYRMCLGAPDQLRKDLGLTPDIKNFNYLNQGSLSESGIDDKRDFQLMDVAMDAVGITNKMDIYRVVAAVLHLGNIQFQESEKDKKGGCEIRTGSERLTSNVAHMLGVRPEELTMALTTRIMTTTKRGAMGTLYKIPLKPEQAAAGRDALAKFVYSKLFDRIVGSVNLCFPYTNSQFYIGVLDIAGFEFFEINSFEQLCINYCNEKLQQFFNERILKDEQMLYDKEGLGVKHVSFIDNQDCIDLFEMKRNGILDLLDEEIKFPSPTDVHFTNEVHSKNKQHFRLVVARKSRLPIHRAVKDDEGFLVRHFAGAVCYQTAGFLEKNNDALHDNLEILLHESTDKFISSLCPPPANPTKTKKLAFESVGKKFRGQLNQLMEKLKNTGSSFIRCIKPNDGMKSGDFEGGQILSQLQCAGMVSVLELMQGGYPSRTSFGELHLKYKSLLPEKLAKLDPRTFCQALFRAVGIESDDFKFGMTKAFFKPGKFAEFDQLMRSDPDSLNALISKVLQWITRHRWKRAIWAAVSVQKLANKIKYRQQQLIVVQKTVKMHLAKRKHKPRYKGLARMNTLHEQLNQLSQLVSMLKKDQDKFRQQVQSLDNEVKQSITRIKTNVMKESEMKTLYTDSVQKISKLLTTLQKQKSAQQEQERMKRLHEQMEAEKSKREEEERKKKEEEELRKQRVAQELKIKEEAELAAKKRKEEELKNQVKFDKMKLEQEQNQLAISQKEAQERRDYELALRLAADPSTMESVERTQLKRNASSGDGKYAHLRKWTYVELRDTINTSCDLELLEGCRLEFHRRLKVYHAWRKRNMEKNKTETQRAPIDIIKQSEGNSVSQPTKASKAQRYFRVPFAKPSDQYRDQEYSKNGYWLGHFDGDWISRQLEIHAHGAVLLKAGVNDEDICELSLTETRLTERAGAEITAQDFDELWMCYGGK